ncbi:MAG: Bacterial regulatory protein tetR family [Blastocatellia bacterium]|nr:Bacterial regulatory protein tetR family [Blastocatellia bacterium]
MVEFVVNYPVATALGTDLITGETPKSQRPRRENHNSDRNRLSSFPLTLDGNSIEYERSFLYAMPKLTEKAVERRKGRIEDAAKQLFIRQGFHATSMRKIASRAVTSLGIIYNFYPTKVAILGSIISIYQ